MNVVSAVTGAALHIVAFATLVAATSTVWDSPHALCVAAAVTLFGGKLVRSSGAAPARGLALA